MKTIAFHSNQLSVRGTEVALYDYAHYNEALLGNRSLVVHHRSNPNNHPDALAKFHERFEVLAYDHLDELDVLLAKRHAQLLYAIKAGRRDRVLSRRIPTMVHAVFPTAPWQVHGSAYAFISEWLSQACSANEIPTVPHIVSMPSNVEGDLRAELSIPKEALVLGCHGGATSYDVPCAISGAKQLLENRSDIYFVFLHLTPFLDHPRAIFLPGTTDMMRKIQFIQTCDAMVHARMQGESFGLACGEFSVLNKPVLTYRYGKHAHHLDVLGSKGMLYGSEDEFIARVNALDRKLIAQGEWDCYSTKYNPERVMSLFDQHLIQAASGNRKTLSARATLSYLRHKIAAKIGLLT